MYDLLYLSLQDKKSKVEHELAAHQQKMRAGGLTIKVPCMLTAFDST